MILAETEPVGLVHNTEISSTGESRHFDSIIQDAKYQLVQIRNEEENQRFATMKTEILFLHETMTQDASTMYAPGLRIME